ncbi:MAG TPA: PEP-CTERM sorting domain-containing protein [Kiritimatiellia bacterium]|nr:PEP-CTERM sorting domain-containing protein [Kiritimatiellia bacterium]HSA19672.1 PEP-CTERM sorting domain-containing protein [Kiritimatiellia bacterium]
MRKIGIVLFVLATAVCTFGEGISWFAEVYWLNYGDGSTRLTGSLSDTSVGCFVQLLWVGANGVIDSAYVDGADGTGATDDLVVDTRWVGAGVGENGYFGGGDIAAGGNIVSGQVYFARTWSAPAANYASGYIPTSPTNRYQNSATWTYPHSNPLRDSFDIAGSGDLNTTLAPLAIPEPGVLALVGLGLIGLRLTRKQR